jgi:hypothetical protein
VKWFTPSRNYSRQMAALRSLTYPPKTPVWKLEAALYCEPCSEGRHYTAASARTSSG